MNSYLISLFIVMTAAIIQYFAGNFPFHFFEFPLNIILGVIWIYSIYILIRENNSSNNISKVLVSPQTTAFSLSEDLRPEKRKDGDFCSIMSEYGLHWPVAS